MMRIALPALTVLLTVAAFIGVAAWNRSGDPAGTLWVTEREAPLTWPGERAPGEDPGLQLHLDVAPRPDPLDARNWLPEVRLRQLGFDLDVPAGAPTAPDVYARVPPRRAWIVLEYEGPTWRAMERRLALQQSDAARPEPPYLAQSRLVPVDAGLDLDALRRRYPTGHLIVPGVVRLAFLPAAAGGPLVYGVLRELTPQTLAVPADLRPVFEGLDPRPAVPSATPRYEVEIAVGRLGLPYLRNARRLE